MPCSVWELYSICPCDYTQNNRPVNFSWMYGLFIVCIYSFAETLRTSEETRVPQQSILPEKRSFWDDFYLKINLILNFDYLYKQWSIFQNFRAKTKPWARIRVLLRTCVNPNMTRNFVHFFVGSLSRDRNWQNAGQRYIMRNMSFWVRSFLDKHK